MAPILLVGAGLVAVLVLLARRDNGDLVSELSDLGEQLSSEVSDTETQLGLTDDPLSIALPLIKRFESWSSKAYPDPPGQSVKWSIGWGHQIQPGEPYDRNSVISRSEGDDLLRVDAGGAYNDVQNNVNTDLSANQIAALISFRYNVGSHAFETSTLLSLVNEGDLDAAANEFSKWVHANGQIDEDLVSRRQQEMELFNS